MHVCLDFGRDGLELVGDAGLAVACRPVVAGVDFLLVGDVGLLFRHKLVGGRFGAHDDELLALEDGCSRKLRDAHRSK